MPAANHNFVIEQGSSFDIIFQFIDSNNLPINLNNWCCVLQWIDSDGDAQVFTSTNKTPNYRLFLDNTGKITFQIPAHVTKNYNFDSATYDLDLQEPNEQYINSGLKTYRLATGTVTLLKRLTPPMDMDCANMDADTSLDICSYECANLDSHAIVYNGNNIVINDNTVNYDLIYVDNNSQIDNIEVVIQGLRHPSPQDLMFILDPPNNASPSVLLSANSKITNYKPGFSFIFSDIAPNNVFLHNVQHNKLCRIKDKTDLISINNFNVLGSIDHLRNQSAYGNWKLNILDTDNGGYGSIDSWKLIITYSSL